jgi:hypothetical protein
LVNAILEYIINTPKEKIMVTKDNKECKIETYLKSIKDELFILNKTLLKYVDFKIQVTKKCMEAHQKCSKK